MRSSSQMMRNSSQIHTTLRCTECRNCLQSGQWRISFVRRQHMWRPLHVVRRRRLQVLAAGTVSTNDFKNGLTVELDGQPFRVMEFMHVKPGKGAAFVRSKLRNYVTGNTVERTFRAGEQVGMADIVWSDAQYTYNDGSEFVFMDLTTYEETRLPRDDSWAKWLKEGMDAQLLKWNDRVISVDLPKNVELQVVETDPGVKGNTQSGGSKPATLETGTVIEVPLFIKVGEVIKVDTSKSEYIGRASS